MGNGAGQHLVSHVSRVQFGESELIDAKVSAIPDYSTDSGILTVTFTSDQPHWRAGVTDLLSIERSSGESVEVMALTLEVRYLGGQSRGCEARFKIVGDQGCYIVEQLLLGRPDPLGA